MGQFLSYALKMASDSQTDETVEYNVNESDNNFEDEFIQSAIREKETEKGRKRVAHPVLWQRNWRKRQKARVSES